MKIKPETMFPAFLTVIFSFFAIEAWIVHQRIAMSDSILNSVFYLCFRYFVACELAGFFALTIPRLFSKKRAKVLGISSSYPIWFPTKGAIYRLKKIIVDVDGMTLETFAFLRKKDYQDKEAVFVWPASSPWFGSPTDFFDDIRGYHAVGIALILCSVYFYSLYSIICILSHEGGR